MEKRHENARGQADRQDSHPRRPRRGGPDPAPHVRAAICPAGPRRADGRLGVDAGAAVRRRLCHPPQLADLPGRARRLDRRRHQHGLCRSAVRRRLADRARLALAARRHLRADDHGRRARPHPALSGAGQLGQRVLDRHRHRRHRGVLRIVGDRLYPRAVHGHAVPAGGVPDRARRRYRARRRHSDRRRVAAGAASTS